MRAVIIYVPTGDIVIIYKPGFQTLMAVTFSGFTSYCANIAKTSIAETRKVNEAEAARCISRATAICPVCEYNSTKSRSVTPFSLSVSRRTTVFKRVRVYVLESEHFFVQDGYSPDEKKPYHKNMSMRSKGGLRYSPWLLPKQQNLAAFS